MRRVIGNMATRTANETARMPLPRLLPHTCAVANTSARTMSTTRDQPIIRALRARLGSYGAPYDEVSFITLASRVTDGCGWVSVTLRRRPRVSGPRANQL